MIQQVHRGNPEVKQYAIVNDFSGGINTADVDERMASNEFRALLNVELSTRGLLQNRKGWGEVVAFTDLLSENNITLPSNIIFMKVVKDTKNILAGIENAEDSSWFTTTNKDYKFHLLIGAGSTIRLFKLEVGTAGDIDVISLSILASFAGSFSQSFKKYSIDIVEHINKVYIPLSQLYVDSNQRGIRGFAIYDVEEESLKVINTQSINSGNIYIPNPYEVRNFGFNVLRANPLDVGGLNSSIVAIYGVYLTNTDGHPLSKIPQQGSFYLNVIHTGIAESDWVDTTIEFYTEDAQGNKTIQLSSALLISDTENVAKLLIELNRPATDALFMSIRLETLPEVDASFNSTADMVNWFYPIAPAEFLAVLDGTRYRIKTLDRLGYYPTYQNYSYYSDASSNSTDIWGSDPLSIWKVGTTIPDSGDPLFVVYGYDPVNQKITKADNASGYTFYAIEDAPYIETLEGRIPTSTATYRAGGVYYNLKTLNGTTFTGYTGTLDDFELDATPPVDIVNYEYIDEFTIGSEETKPISSILTATGMRDARMLIMQERLVIYFENVMWFSDYHNFTYFPYFNFISLPLVSGDKIQSINYYRGSWIVFTKERIYRISGEFGGADFSITLINDAIGCYAPFSVRSFNNTLAWLSSDGFYVLKQNFYQDGLENVEKIDKHITGLYTISDDVQSVMYNEQVWWLFKNETGFDTLKGYYNQKGPRGIPFTVDKYQTKPLNISSINNELYSIRNGVFYKYDMGYKDFLPNTTPITAEMLENSMYQMTIITSNFAMGHPTHEKKFRNLFIKTNAHTAIPLKISIFVDNIARLSAKDLIAIVNSDGTITYQPIENPNFETDDVYSVDPNAVLGSFIMGRTTIGEVPTQLHKIALGFKGRNITLQISQGGYDQNKPIDEQVAEYFGFQDLGYSYKLGKVRENRW